jgi:predicted N-acyltransferase
VSGPSCRVFDDLDEIDPGEWDSLLEPGDLHAAFRFLRTCRHAGIADATYRYLLVDDGGRLAATAALTCLTVALDLLAPRAVRAVARVGRAIHPPFLRLRVLFCGLPVSLGGSCLRLAPDADPGRVLPLVTGAMEEFAQAQGAGLLCFKEHTEAECAPLDGLRSYGYFRAPSLPASYLPIEWPDFDAYLAAMRSGYRRQVRASLAARSTRGLTFRIVEDWAAECPGIHALYEQVMERAEFQLERLPLAFFERLNAEFGSGARALLLERDGRLEAAAILIYAPRVLTFLLAGIDYARNRADRAYQNLVAEVVAEAIRCGAARLELGQTSYALKSRLGGLPDPRWIYLRHRRGLTHQALRAASGLLFPAVPTPARRVFAAPAGATGRP